MSGILTYVLHYQGQFNKNSLGAVSEAAMSVYFVISSRDDVIPKTCFATVATVHRTLGVIIGVV